MTQQFVFANNAGTTLGSPVNTTQTTITLSSGAGSLFPSPTGSQQFAVSMLDALTRSVYEIMYCTSRTGDVLTVLRAQEGTTARSWLAGDFVNNYITAGTAANFAQGNNYSYAVNVQNFTATAGQTLFTLTSYSYIPGTNTLSVYVNGLKQILGESYTETSSISFTFVNGLNVGTHVQAIFGNVIPTAVSSASVGYNEGGTGAVTTTVQAKLQQSVSIVDFGGVADGTTNNSTALQAAHDALPSSGGTIYIPTGSSYYLFTSGVSFTKPIVLIGAGIYSSIFYTATSSITLISTTKKLDIENLHFEAYSAARTTAVFIQQSVGSTGNNHSTYFNCLFDGGATCYHSLYTSQVVFDNCQIYPQGSYGLYLENTVSSDQGDSFITNCTFSGATTANIFAPSTSGLYVTNNKFNNSFAHINISTGSNNTGDYTFTGNSFEGHTSYGIQLVSSSGTLTKSLITGNQFSSGTAGVAMNHIIVGNNAINTVITGNSFNSTDATQTTHNAILIQNGSYNTTITGNDFYQIYNAISGATNTSLGITAASNRYASDVTIIDVGDDNATIGTYASSLDFSISRYFQESAGTLTTAYQFQGSGTLEIIIYGVAQGAGNVLYTRKVAMYNTTTTADINAPLAQGSAITVALTSSGGYMNLQVAKSAGTSFTGYVEVIARGQIYYIKKV